MCVFMTQRGQVGGFFILWENYFLFRPIGSTGSNQILEGYLKTWNHAKPLGR